MSRSFRRTPITGVIHSDTEKSYKQDEHRRERSAVRQALRTTQDDAAVPHPKKYGNPWAGPKDGKRFWTDIAKWLPKWRRK